MTVPALVDLRSDTVTLPTPAMRRAMAEAEVGDDVYGEDPTVRALEHAGAQWLGMAAAVFLPSGTMANQIAVHVHCRPGDELLCDARAHVFCYEGGGAARWSGTTIRPLATADGFPTPQQVLDAPHGDDAHLTRTRLLVLENTHNMAGGRIASAQRMAALIGAARERQLRVHVDGARLANAAVALGVQPADLLAGADSSTLCLSKGLGAPVGSLLAGGEAFVAAARRARKAFGGGMRQAGVLAAAGLLALRDGPAALVEDHRRARQLAAGLAALPWARVDVGSVDSNIVMLHGSTVTLTALRASLDEQHVRVSLLRDGRLRFVLHRDVDDAGLARVLAACVAFVPPTEAHPPTSSD